MNKIVPGHILCLHGDIMSSECVCRVKYGRKERAKKKITILSIPYFSSPPLISSHCSPNEDRSLCLRFHLATWRDLCHTAEKDLIWAGKGASPSSPKQREEDNVFSSDFLFSSFNLLQCNSLKERGKGDSGWKEDFPFSLWLIFSTIFCSGSPHCTWERWRAQQPLWERHFISKTGLQSTCCYCWGCKSRGLRAKMDFLHNSSSGWPLLAFFAHRTKCADVVPFEWQRWFVLITQGKPNKKKIIKWI